MHIQIISQHSFLYVLKSVGHRARRYRIHRLPKKQKLSHTTLHKFENRGSKPTVAVRRAAILVVTANYFQTAIRWSKCTRTLPALIDYWYAFRFAPLEEVLFNGPAWIGFHGTTEPLALYPATFSSIHLTYWTHQASLWGQPCISSSSVAFDSHHCFLTSPSNNHTLRPFPSPFLSGIPARPTLLLQVRACTSPYPTFRNGAIA